MSLPSGYTRVEYIQSSGTQYINTGFVPNGNSRIVIDFQQTDTATSGLFGARGGVSSNCFCAWVVDGTSINPQYGSVAYTAKPISLSTTTRRIVDMNKGTVSVGGTSVSFGTSSFSAGVALTVLAMNTSGSIDTRMAKAKLYSCQIYDNGTLVRDFIPCTNASGAAGLWDDVNSVFYANTGTGSFTAGPEVAPIPSAPTGLNTILAVVLVWTAAQYATSYKVYRGGVLIGSTTAAQFVDTSVSPNETYTYSVTAVNSSGESEAATVTVYTKTGYFQYKPLIQDATFHQTPST